jgi:hypothetical protein
MIGQLCGSPLKATQGTIDYDPTGKVRYQHQARLEQGNKQPRLQTTTIYWPMYSGEVPPRLKGGAKAACMIWPCSISGSQKAQRCKTKRGVRTTKYH